MKWLEFVIVLRTFICLESLEINPKIRFGGFAFHNISTSYDESTDGIGWLSNELEISYIMADTYETNHLLVIIKHAILKLDLQIKWLSLLAGSPYNSGFSNDVRNSARFSHPYGMAYLPDTNSQELLVVDSGNCCIRVLDRSTNRVDTFAGKCQEPDEVDGWVQQARFPRIKGLEISRGNEYILYTFSATSPVTIYRLDIGFPHNISTVRILRDTSNATSRDLQDVEFDLAGENVMFTFNKTLVSRSVSSFQQPELVGSRDQYDSSTTSDATLIGSCILFLSNNVIVFTNSDISRLTAFDLLDKTFATVCVPDEIAHRICTIPYSKYLIKHPTKNEILVAAKLKIISIAYSEVPNEPPTESTPSTSTQTSVTLSTSTVLSSASLLLANSTAQLFNTSTTQQSSSSTDDEIRRNEASSPAKSYWMEPTTIAGVALLCIGLLGAALCWRKRAHDRGRGPQTITQKQSASLMRQTPQRPPSLELQSPNAHMRSASRPAVSSHSGRGPQTITQKQSTSLVRQPPRRPPSSEFQSPNAHKRSASRPAVSSHSGRAQKQRFKKRASH